MAIYTLDSLASVIHIKGAEEDELQERRGEECWNVKCIWTKLEDDYS